MGLIFYYITAQKHAGATIMIGTVALIFQYLGQLMSSFWFYTGDYESVIHQQTDFEAITPILTAAGTLPPAEATRLAHWHKLLVHPLCFSYDEAKLQLRDVSLCLARKRKIALIGESGCGKSTLLQLLRGLNETPNARLTVDDDRSMSLSVLAETTTLIPQEPEIFENTIRHNITMGIPASDEELEHALWVAGFDKVVTSLPNGLESDIREKGHKSFRR